MGNMLDYLEWRGDISIEQDKFNYIDALILAEISYMDFDGCISNYFSHNSVSLKKACERLFHKHKKEDINMGVIVPQTIVELVYKVKDCSRFNKFRMSNYVNKIDMDHEVQFSAMCFEIDSETIYVAYRGTDDTLIGWQENFNMVCDFPVPGQIAAADYLNDIARHYPGKKIIIGGHSKGGNLAVYAAIYCKEFVKKRIVNCFSFDGPGFLKDSIDEKKFTKIKDKIIKVLPSGSVVGMIFEEYSGQKVVVKSTGKGIYQHDGFTWELNRNRFITVKHVSKGAIKLDNAITKMVDELNAEERVQFANDLYAFIRKTNQMTLVECTKNKMALVKACRGINRKNTRIFVELFIKIFRFGFEKE